LPQTHLTFGRVRAPPSLRLYSAGSLCSDAEDANTSTSYSCTLTGTDANEVGDRATRLTQQLQKSEVLRDVASEAQDNGS